MHLLECTSVNLNWSYMPYTIQTEIYDNSFSEFQIMKFFEQHFDADDVWQSFFCSPLFCFTFYSIRWNGCVHRSQPFCALNLWRINARRSSESVVFQVARGRIGRGWKRVRLAASTSRCEFAQSMCDIFKVSNFKLDFSICFYITRVCVQSKNDRFWTLRI